MSDSTNLTYRVVFWGDVAAGQSRRDVALKFAHRFRIRETRQLKRIFSGRLMTLKKDLSEAEAQRYCRAITDLGAKCRMERETHALTGVNWGGDSDQPEPKRPRHTASIHFDTLGFGIEDFIQVQADADSAPDEGAIEGSRNPFGAREVTETEHPPVKYYDGRPVR
ncbi:hypothetical protein [Pseudomaricurvus sp.]|uniref:hypothetical protein n=1 Tax=Pseudomaricurvus sp. TaxID=2004510 RepID=UPI003F6A7A52